MGNAPPSGVLHLLWQGGAGALKQPWLRRQPGVTRVLSVYPGGIENAQVFVVPISAATDADLQSAFQSGVVWIHEQRLSGFSVFVNCRTGVSSSSAMVCAYLICRFGVTADQALQYLHRHRRCSDPTFAMIRQLELFAVEHVGSARAQMAAMGYSSVLDSADALWWSNARLFEEVDADPDPSYDFEGADAPTPIPIHLCSACVCPTPSEKLPNPFCFTDPDTCMMECPDCHRFRHLGPPILRSATPSDSPSDDDAGSVIYGEDGFDALREQRAASTRSATPQLRSRQQTRGQQVSNNGEQWDEAAVNDGPNENESQALLKPTVSTPPDTTTLSVSAFIIITELCERIAFYGFQGSLVLYMTRELHMSSGAADAHVSTWNGACFVTPLLGAWIADTHTGRYRTILAFGMLYLLGLIAICITAQKSMSNGTAFFISLYVIALATGGIKPNVSTFGADQFMPHTIAGVRSKQKFFSWFYMAINVGALIAFTAVAYLCQNVSFSVGYMVPALLLVVALVLFRCGKNRYYMEPVKDFMLGTFVAIVFQGLSRGCCRCRNSSRNKSRLSSPGHLPTDNEGVHHPADRSHADRVDEKHTDSECDAQSGNTGADDGRIRRTSSNREGSSSAPDTSQVVSSTDMVFQTAPSPSRRPMPESEQAKHGAPSPSRRPESEQAKHETPLHWIQFADRSMGGSYESEQVARALCVARLFPILACFILYYVAYGQMGTGWFNQGCQLDLRLPGGFTMPVAALNVFDTFIIVAIIPLLQTCVYPALDKCGCLPSLMSRIQAGFVLATLALACSGVLEWSRRRAFLRGDTIGPSVCFDNPQILAVNMSIFWQVPQFVLLGLSEVLAAVSALELFYIRAPTGMRSVCAALSLLSTALGTWMIVAVIGLTNGISRWFGTTQWVAHDANKGRLDWYFFLLAALMGLDCVLLAVVRRSQHMIDAKNS